MALIPWRHVMTRELDQMRETVWFSSGDDSCEAWLYLPAAGGPLPAIVMAHGLGNVKSARLEAYAERFSAAGYVCLVFDYRHFGGSGGAPRQLLSVQRQLADWEAAISFARSLPAVDPERVVVWGTSFGGGHAITMAARDHRLAAAIAQCPFTDGRSSSRTTSLATSLKVTALAIRDLLAARRSKAPVHVATAGRPGTAALMNAPDALPGYESICRDAPDFDNRVAARAVFDVLGYAPGRQAAEITCPLLAALCEHDSVAPAGTAQRQLARAPRAEVRLYPIGHFDIYLGQAYERAVTDYLAFLSRHVPLSVQAR